MDFARGKCMKCGKAKNLVPSNNPLVSGICFDCVRDSIDPKNLEHFEFFCRTYNLPFDPEIYIHLYKVHKEKVLEEYIKYLVMNEESIFETETQDLWKKADEEWQKLLTHEELLDNIEPIKDDFVRRSKIKWGAAYNFEELVMLENLFENTIKIFNITDPMQIDAIKKACKMSIQIDKAMIENDTRAMKDLTSSYASFMKIAKLEEMQEAAVAGTIKTVADLGAHLERSGYRFQFYDNVERDIVDKTINDMKEIIRTEVGNATGLIEQLENIKASYEMKMEKLTAQDEYEAKPLDLIVSEYEKSFEEELDAEEEDDILGDAYE